jgi:hypothetical protein
MLAAAIIILLIIILIVLLLMVIHPIKKQEPTVYIIGSTSRNFDDTVWPASYWNWYGGARGWGSRPEHRWTAGPGYKPAGNYGPRYIDRHRPSHH